MSQGNVELLQQQQLMAALLKQVIKQVSNAYAGSMDKTFTQLNVTESNSFRDVRDLARRVASGQEKLTKDVQATIYKTQDAANQLIDRLPFSHPTPVYYGMTARDLLSDREASAVDIEVLGFLMSDSRLNYKQPVLRVGGDVLPRESVAVQHDGVNVTLPYPVKKKVGMTNGMCEPRAPFPVSIEVFYAVPTEWYVFWRKYDEKSATFNSNAMPGAQTFEVLLEANRKRTVKTAQPPTAFDRPGDSINVGCDEGLAGSVSVAIPDDAKISQCGGEWKDIANIKSHDAQACSAITGGMTVSGGIRGLDKNWAGCPGGGHATLHIVGSYVVTTTTQVAANSPPVGPITMRDKAISHTLSVEPDTALTLETAVDRLPPLATRHEH